MGAIFICGNRLKTLQLCTLLISPDLYLVLRCPDVGSLDILDTFKLLCFVKKMWEYPSDIRLFENSIDPN